MIRMNDFTRETNDKKEELIDLFSQFLDSGYYILGPHVAAFEQEFAKFVGSRYAVGVANGLEALQIALLALNIGQGDEVITVANTAIATALAVKQVGATPVLVDIDEYYHMSPRALEAAISPRTKAIIPVHLFGQIVNWSEIRRIAAQHAIPIIEDACQAHGATYQKKQAGSLGTLGCFSFYPTKNLGAYGDGGAITTSSKELYEKCVMLRNYGQSKRYHHEVVGINSRLDELQAVFLRSKLRTLRSQVAMRRKLAQAYTRELAAIPQIKVPPVRSQGEHSFHLFVVEAEQRDELLKYLKDHEIESLIHYPIPIHKQNAWQPCDLHLPATERAAENLLSLPINPYLTIKEVKTVCAAIASFYASTTPSVTIGIPAHNEQKNIAALLKSIAEQNQSAFTLQKVLVLCDGCTDKTAQIVRKLMKKMPHLQVVDDGQRLGQAERLNQLYSQSNSDITIALDADITLTSPNSLRELVVPFRDPAVGLVGGNNIPYAARSFFESVVVTYELVWRAITANVKNGHNVHNHPGCMSAARQSYVKQLAIPSDAVANDHWLYFAMVHAGHRFAFAPLALSAFRVPTTLREYLLQTARFLHSNGNMTQKFASLAEKEYAIPRSIKMKTYASYFLHHPVRMTCALLLQAVQRLSMPFLKEHGTVSTWTIISTSKG